MRIACLQFAPRFGDIDNNLNRADSVLSKANPDDLDNLDLLVLPELAFSGCNFKSLHQISPFLEPSTSGISSLWARTAALKYDTTVVVGYPEKVDVSPRWPTSPEYYNSAIMVNRDGKTIANYRSSFLWAADEKWALEGNESFFHSKVQDLGDTVIGIGMDLNPYRFESPWHKFEFAFHVLETQANLVIVTMAWSTREEARMFSRSPAEPDMDTLTYWAQRLEPLIRAESKEEIIVVFCNRCGKEDTVVYAGTSAVIGIKEGEVNVYGLLGRGVKDLLVVDTDVVPFAKLVHRPEADVSGGSLHVPRGRATNGGISTGSPPTFQHIDSVTVEDSVNGNGKPTHTPSLKTETKRQVPASQVTIPSPSLQHLPLTTPIDESPGVATPTAPSPTPFSKRPQLENYVHDEGDHGIMRSRSRSDAVSEYLDFPIVYHDDAGVNPSPSKTDAPSPGSGQVSEKYFWLPPQTTFKAPRDANFPELPPVSPVVAVSLLKIPGDTKNPMKHLPAPELALSPELGGGYPPPDAVSTSTLSTPSNKKHGSSRQATDTPTSPRPASPKLRNASRTGRPLDRRPSEADQPDLSDVIEHLHSLTRRPGSAFEPRGDDAHDNRQGRPRTPKSRPMSRTGRPLTAIQLHESTVGKGYQAGPPTRTSPSVPPETKVQGRPDPQPMDPRSFDRRAHEPGTIRPCPRARASSRNRSITGRDFDSSRPRSGSATNRANEKSPHIEPDETRKMVWSELSNPVGEVRPRPKTSRTVSRGGKPTIERSMSADVSWDVRATRSETRGIHSGPPVQQRVASQDRHAIMGDQSRRTASHSRATGKIDGPTNPCDPEDAIVVEIIFHHQGCPTHGHRHQSSPSAAGTTSQSGHTENTPSLPKNASRPNQGQDSRASQRCSPPQPPRKNSMPAQPKPSRSSSKQNGFGASRSPPLLSFSKKQNSNGTFPNLDGISTNTITTENGSPAISPPRVFEPTTPKAMKLGESDFGSGAFTSKSDSTEHGDLALLKSMVAELPGVSRHRPKSAIW